MSQFVCCFFGVSIVGIGFRGALVGGDAKIVFDGHDAGSSSSSSSRRDCSGISLFIFVILTRAYTSRKTFRST